MLDCTKRAAKIRKDYWAHLKSEEKKIVRDLFFRTYHLACVKYMGEMLDGASEGDVRWKAITEAENAILNYRL